MTGIEKNKSTTENKLRSFGKKISIIFIVIALLIYARIVTENIIIHATEIMIALYKAIIIHEIGHLLMGLLTGYKFVKISFLGITIFKQENKKKSFEVVADTRDFWILSHDTRRER